jgi:hypothetical protein
MRAASKSNTATTDLTEMHSTRLLGQRPMLASLSPVASLVELG